MVFRFINSREPPLQFSVSVEVLRLTEAYVTLSGSVYYWERSNRPAQIEGLNDKEIIDDGLVSNVSLLQ